MELLESHSPGRYPVVNCALDELPSLTGYVRAGMDLARDLDPSRVGIGGSKSKVSC